LFLDLEPWRQLRPLFDDTVFVSCPLDVAMGRVLARQVGNGAAPAAARARVDSNDRANGELVAATAGAARLLVPSSVPFSSASSSS
jgi:pantothenate kinase